jgi:hypothetical protein
VFAAIPRAKAITAAAVNPGFRSSSLVPNRTSRQKEFMSSSFEI